MNAKIIGLLIRPLLLLLLLLFVNDISTFNLDVGNYIRHEGQDGSMFGFSVALHQEQQRRWVIIGAPKADTSQFQPGVEYGGAVYRCDISDDNRCQIIHFDSNGNNYNERNEQIDTKSNQWFGATVSSAGVDGPLVACAPRYVYHQHQPKKVERNEPVGTCFIAKDNFKEFHEFSPCRTMYWGYHRQGSCQAGLSATVNKEGDRLFIGAPGSWYWQGQLYSINTEAVYPFKPPRYGQFGDGGQMYSYSLNNPKDRVYSTKESSSKEDDSYLGYSSTTGDFNGDGLQGVAVGMPRGAGLLGKVLIFSWNLTNQVNITGEQIGAYFGYSLCSIDVDGDKLDDLIIGAPMHTEPNNEGKYETGLVYIVYQNKFNKFKELETRAGTTSRGRFGLSLAALGDINLDGYGDFAVGAPYDGPNGRGAVYIFHGSPDGPLKKASQVIYAEDIVGTSQLSTFGFSLAGGIDLDRNQYPDLVVGAYESNAAFVFKSRAVAVMEASTVFESENKLISLDNKNCTLSSDRKQVACTTVTSCLKYNGVNVPATIDIEISWVLDSKKTKTPRMFFVNEETRNIRNSTMRLYRGKPECRSDNVYIVDGIRDKLTPLEVEMKYNIRQASSTYSTSTQSRRVRSPLEPVFDENRGTVQRDSINIMKNCGKDNICIPDLQLDVKTNEKYILGGNESLSVDVFVNNNGEDAFEASFFMTVPQGLDFKSTRKISESRETSYTCTAPTQFTNYTLKCDIGNPLPAGKSISFKVIFEPSRKAGLTPFYDFYMEANSTNEEAEGGRFDNVFKKSVAISVESDLSISGSSMPAEFHYNISHYKEFENATHEAEIGQQIVHIYDIRNNGTSTIEEIELFINWPAMTLDKYPLMYLLNQPETQGNVYCEPTQFVNQANLQIDYSLERKSYLDKNRAPIRSGESRFSSSSWQSSNRYNTQGGATFDEKNMLDRDESQEVSGDASLVHASRSESGYYGNRQSHGSSTSGRGRVAGSTGVTSQTAENSGTSGSGHTNFDWSSQGGRTRGSFRNRTSQVSHQGSTQSSFEAAQGSGSGSSFEANYGSQGRQSSGSTSSYDVNYGAQGRQGSSGSSSSHDVNYGAQGRQGSSGSSSSHDVNYGAQGRQGSSGSSSSYDVNYGAQGRQGSSGSDSRYESNQSGSNARGSSGQTSGFDTSFIGSTGSGAGGGNVREYEYQESWNSSSVNGGPAVTHYSSQNQTFHRGQGGGRVLISETSTETVITGGVGHASWGNREASRNERRKESESRQTDSTVDVEYERQLHEYYEQQRKYQEEQRQRQILERRKQQEAQRQAEQERIRAEEVRLVEERRLEEERREEERRRSQSSTQGSTIYESSHTRYTGGRQGGANRSQSSSSSSSYGTGRIETNFDENVHQDISSMADRTHATNTQSQSSGSHTGRRRMMSQQDGEPPRPDLVSGVSSIEKAAQGGHGFQTVGLDLGILGGRNNVDEEMRRQSSSSGNVAGGSQSRQSSSSSYSTQYSSGSRAAGSTSGYSQTSYNQGLSDDEYEDVQEYDDDQYDNNQGRESSYNTHSSYSYSHQSDPQLKHYRKVRDVSIEHGNKELCESAHCVNVRCVVGPLDKNTGALIALRMRLVAHTLHRIGGEADVRLSTMAIGKVTKLPYVGTPANEIVKSHEVFVTAIPDPVPKPDIIPLWVFVLAACVGALILLLLIYLLYKCGFFKRNRPTGSSHERQPLNRNGNYHGDEHL